METVDPLILLEGEEGPQEGPPRPGTARVFDTVEELIAAIEAADVRYGLYQAFDMHGRRLRLEAGNDAGPVTATFEPGDYAADLRKILGDYVRRLPPRGARIDPDLPLSGLVESIRRLGVDREADRRNRRKALVRRVAVWLLLMAAVVVARPVVLQPSAAVPTLITVGTWIAVTLVAYWLAGRLLTLWSPDLHF